MNAITIYINPRQAHADGTYTVYVTTTVERKILRFNTGVRAAKSEIDFKRGCLRSAADAGRTKNIIVENCRARLTNIFVRYRLLHIKPTAEQVRHEYEDYAEQFLFYEYALKKLCERRESIAPGTYRRHASQLEKIKRFCPAATIADINADFVQRLHSWCRGECKNSLSGIANTIKVLKFYHAKAVKEKLAKPDALCDVRVRFNTVHREYLTVDELQKLIALYRSGTLLPAHQNVLRYFLFSCLTGLRFGDVAAFSKRHMVGNTIVLQMQKTRRENGKMVTIPITRGVRELLGNLDEIYSVDDPVFRVISNQRTNDYLREILAIAGLPKRLTYHCSRHTFASNFLAHNGEKIATLQELLGHTNITQTRMYTHVRYESMEKDMQFLNNIW